jgi:hypothetical protein
MGSLREDMKRRLRDAEEIIRSLKFQRESLDKEIAAVELASTQLKGEPVEHTDTALLIHYDRPSRFISVADCLECGTELEGYKSNWKYCPVCGSTVTKAQEEKDPNDRLTRKALQEALKPLNLVAGAK